MASIIVLTENWYLPRSSSFIVRVLGLLWSRVVIGLDRFYHDAKLPAATMQCSPESTAIPISEIGSMDGVIYHSSRLIPGAIVFVQRF